MSSVVEMPDRRGLAARVAENVRVECARKGWKQSDLARAMQMSTTSINTRWMGARQWQLEDIEQLSKVLGVPESRLLNTARPEGLEPPTFWSVVQRVLWFRMTGRVLPFLTRPNAPVVDLHSRERVA